MVYIITKSRKMTPGPSSEEIIGCSMREAKKKMESMLSNFRRENARKRNLWRLVKAVIRVKLLK